MKHLPFICLQAKSQVFLAQLHRSASHKFKPVTEVRPVCTSAPGGGPKSYGNSPGICIALGDTRPYRNQMSKPFNSLSAMESQLSCGPDAPPYASMLCSDRACSRLSVVMAWRSFKTISLAASSHARVMSA